MKIIDNQTETIDYQVATVSQFGTSSRSTYKVAIAQISVPINARPAAAMTEELRRRFGWSTIQLALLPPTKDEVPRAVHELLSDVRASSEPVAWRTIDEAHTSLNDEQMQYLYAIIGGIPNDLGCFARIEWIDELMIELGYGVDRARWPDIRQLNQGIGFCLLAISDRTRRRWFKAVGPPNTSEFPITVGLATLLPRVTPSIVLTIPRWNGWVAEDVIGESLHDCISMDSWLEAFRCLADLQITLADHTDWLETAGAERWSLERLDASCDHLFDEAEIAMRHQTSTKSRPLSGNDLRKLKQDLRRALSEMDDGLPCSLTHGDLGHGNIIASNVGPVFIDWAGCYLSHPLISAEHLSVDFLRSHRTSSSDHLVLLRAYLACWCTRATRRALRKSARVAPAVAAYIYAAKAWTMDSQVIPRSNKWLLLRSQLRRTRLELDALKEVEL